MKKIISLFFIPIFLILVSGCDSIENATIYTTVYPVQFLSETLYGEHSTSTSIYPDGADVKTYELTDKLIERYSKGTIFLYNGTTEEKQIAKKLVNERKKLKIIDVAYSLKYKYGVEELWLSPSNFLMLATNLRNGLEEQMGSKYLNEEIDKKYRELEVTLSIIDAEIRSIAKEAISRNQNTIVTSSNVFKYLEDYGFRVISLEDYEENSNSFNTLKSNFNSGTYKYLFIKNQEETDRVKELKSQNNAEVISVNMLSTLTEEAKKSNENYFSIMNDFITNLKKATNY